MPYFSELLKKYVKTERRVKSANHLAKEIGMAATGVTKWLNGDVVHPNCEKVLQCANVLNLTPTERDEFLKAANCKDFKPSPPPPEEPIPVIGIPIYHPCQLFGREDALRRIYGAWHQEMALQNVAIIGPRHSGKTSLLNYLKKIACVPKTQLRSDQPKGWLDGWLPHRFQFAEIDFKDKQINTPLHIMDNVLEQLGVTLTKPFDLFDFSNVLKQQQKPTVILMDDIGDGLKASKLDATFWQQMRFLAGSGAGGRLGLVVTAHDSLDKLAQAQDKSSPFFGIFNTVYLEPLTEKEASEMLASLQNLFESKDIEWMLEQSHCWPALLQILCNERILALKENKTDDSWKTEGLKRLAQYQYLQEFKL
ncbi:MAG TPA: ATP-binding protein [Thioploca sp.]|nr:ATP-binding protein [Thioploca sp.]